MIEVFTPLNPEFQKYEAQAKELYEKNQEKICDPNPFSFIKKYTFFYIFIKNGTFIGAIYYFVDNNKLFLNGFAIPKNHTENLYCLKLSTTWFSSDIYAEAQNKASTLCLLKCGYYKQANRAYKLLIKYSKGVKQDKTIKI